MRNRGSSIETALAHNIGEVIFCIMATDKEGIETLQSRLARAEEEEEAKPPEEEVVENQEDRDEEEEEAKPAEEDPVASQEAPLDLDFPECMDDDDVPLRQPLGLENPFQAVGGIVALKGAAARKGKDNGDANNELGKCKVCGIGTKKIGSSSGHVAKRTSGRPAGTHRARVCRLLLRSRGYRNWATPSSSRRSRRTVQNARATAADGRGSRSHGWRIQWPSRCRAECRRVQSSSGSASGPL